MSGALVSTRTDAAEPPARKVRRRVPRKVHAYFIAFTLVFTAFVLAGFSRSFFIPVASGTFSRPPFVYIHPALERADIIRKELMRR